jgi:hypothetical protein
MDPAHPDAAPLTQIPLIDVGRRGPLALLDAARPRADALIEVARRRYGRFALRCGDAVSRAWLRRNVTRYCGEIEAVAARLGAAGTVMLNLSFEWGCTGLVEPDAAGGLRMLRVLDWRLEGLGRHVVVARVSAEAGPYYDVTWPGAVGVLTAMAPGRFSAAIHQAPMRRHGLTVLGDWARNRALVWRRTALTPAHLLRHVFETAPDYAAARRMLAETPLALPVMFLLAGTTPDESCVIERTEDDAVIHDGPGVAGNCWRRPDAFGPGVWSARGYENDARIQCLAGLRGQPARGFDWLVPPVLNPDTRLAVKADPRAGTLAVVGYEAMRPVTTEFHVRHEGVSAGLDRTAARKTG